MKHYTVAVISFSVIFYLTMIIANMVMATVLPSGTEDGWEAAAQHSDQIVVQGSVYTLPLVVAAVIAFGAGYLIFKRFTDRIR
ncbi:hypothetical protein [Salinicoccus bachuensis]|uniref:Uncharacterized protein n=1 Tax=Salinicoccus bachuensis TaxID=3136731 RepID=A0ABZ3CLK3_9STAP